MDAQKTHHMQNNAQNDNVFVVFTPSGKRGNFPIGTPVLQAARELGVDIDSVCGGRAICGRCQITLAEGEFAKHGISSKQTSLSQLTKIEQRYEQKKGLKKTRRLSCQATLQKNAVIDIPPESQIHKQVVRKRADAAPIECNPIIRLYYIHVQEPDMHHPSSDLERVYMALKGQWNIEDVTCDLSIMGELQKTLRDGKWKITVAIHNRMPLGGKRIIAMWPEFHDAVYGMAVDVGSTTVAAHLCNLASGNIVASAGLMNPQIRFGEDLMSRVSYVMMNPGGDTEMTDAIRDTLNVLAGQLAVEAMIDLNDILEVTIVGNPIMHHLLLGINPVELGGAPFALATGLAVTRPAREIDLRLNNGAYFYALPCIAGHVGADAAGVTLSEGPHLFDEITLLVDVGTNAEIILGNKHKILACSSPTGPAFEGAQISSGQRAAPGAIERIRINPETLEPKFKLIDSTLWSDEDGFEETIETTGVTGICGSGIIEAIAEMFLAGIISHDGVINGEMEKKTPRLQQDGRTFSYVIREQQGEPTIAITQNDVRAIQLAKAALYAGIRLLMDHMNIQNVDKIRLAGAFGTHIDVKYAMILGLIPDCPIENVQSAGNAAGTGARIALLNHKARDEVENFVCDIEKIETAVEPKFQEHFVDAMAIPHKTAQYPNLEKICTIPKPNKDSDQNKMQKRKRRRKG